MLKKGFTLIEVLVTALITGFVLTGLAMTISFATTAANDAALIANLSNIGQVMQASIINDIRNNASLTLEDIKTGSTVIGSKLVIKDRDKATAFEYLFYNSSATELKRNKLYKKTGSGTEEEMKPITVGKLPFTMEASFNLNGTTYEADVQLTLTYKKDNVDYKKCVVKNIAVSCRNYSKT